MHALGEYGRLRDRLFPQPRCDAFLVSLRGTRLRHNCIHHMFAQAGADRRTSTPLAALPAAASRSETFGGRQGYAPCLIVLAGIGGCWVVLLSA